MEIDRFERLYQTIDIGEGGFITLLTLDGTLITRAPDFSRFRGRKFHSHEVLAAVQSAGRFDGWTSSPISGERVLVSASAVRGFPLLVASGGTEGAVLAPWRDQAWLVTLRTLLTSIAVLALIALAAWGLARRERALQRSEKRFRAMIEHSGDAVALTRPAAGGVFYTSPAFERITG
jgi:PAS domain-containing protein